ncbi:MAG: sulfatase-like hydrolase/transferase [Opitutaceae bacterium]|nr:sulfatase-like hydrolase/transferase [Opitutaceae bacterium]
MNQSPLRLIPAIAFLLASGLLSAATPAARPNIVFIMADDLGWGDVGFHGGNAPTPNLDRLAREGLELAAHYVAPVCSPTRTGLMTGRCWSRFGVTNPQNDRALPWDTLTLPRALQTVGYDTALVGKWHLGSKPEQGPNRFGFDHAYGSLAGGVSPYSHKYKKGPYSETWHRNGRLISEEGHVTELLTREAVSWIETRGDRPFMLYVPYTAVHLPVREPEEWVARVPAGITGEVARHYAASIMHLDDGVGRILAALERTGRRANTLVVVTSDNGGSTAQNNDTSYPDDQCPSGTLPGRNLPWRGKKGDLHEGGIRVPTVVSWPAGMRPGRVETPVQIIDWLPTFAALAGYQPAADPRWDGTDLSALLTRHVAPPARPLYSVAPGWRARSLRFGNWKLIVTGDGAKAAHELYDLVADPAEKRNLADEQPARLRDLLGTLAQVAARDRDAMAKD